MRSNDDGITFTKAVDITAALDGLKLQFAWAVVALDPGHAIQLQNGWLLVPVWISAGEPTAEGHRKHAPSGIMTLYSDNYGKTWKHGDLTATDSPEITNPNEMQVIQLANGSVMANIRTGDKRELWLPARMASATGPSRSSTSTYMTPSALLVLCVTVLYLETIAIASYLGFTNPDSDSLSGSNKDGRGLRRNLTLKMSEDEDKT